MLHIRRPCASCYRILSNSCQHLYKGRSFSNITRPLVAKGAAQEYPGWLKATRSLQAFSARRFCSTEVTEQASEDSMSIVEDEPPKPQPGMEKLFMKTRSLQSYSLVPEQRYRLYLKLKDPHIRKRDIYEMSEDIKDVFINTADGRRFAFVKFASKEIMEDNYTLLSARGDVHVGYARDSEQEAGRDLKMLRIHFMANEKKSVEEILEMSEDIKKVQNLATAHAHLVFESEEAAVNNFKKLKQRSDLTAVNFVGMKESASNWRNLQLMILNLEEGVTKEDIESWSDDILHVKITSRDNKRIAYLKFGNEQIRTRNQRLLRTKLGLNVRRLLGSEEEADERVLCLIIDKDTTENNLYDLSDDIARVSIAEKDGRRFGYMEFGNVQQALENCRKLKETYGRKVMFLNNRQNSVVSQAFQNRVVCLGAFPPSSEVTREKLMNLSEYILDAYVALRKDGSSNVMVEFSSVEKALDAYRRWRMKELTAFFLNDSSYKESEENRKLVLHEIRPDVTRRDLFSLSKDIINVVEQRGGDQDFAVLVFPTEAVAASNYKLLKPELGNFLRFSFRTGGPRDRTLLLFDVPEDATEDSLKELSDDVLTVRLPPDGSIAQLEFVSQDVAVKNCKLLNKKGYKTVFEWESGSERKQRRLEAKVVDEALTVADIEKMFPEVLKVDLMKTDARIAILEFATVDDMEKNLGKFEDPSVKYKLALPRVLGGKKAFRLYVADIVSVENLKADLEGKWQINYEGENDSGLKFVIVEFKEGREAWENIDHLKAKGYNANFAINNSGAERCLQLTMNRPDITEKEIKLMSPDIQKVILLPSDTSEKTKVCVEFESERKAEEIHDVLAVRGQKEDFSVKFIGQKQKDYIEEQKNRSLYIRFPNDQVTEEDIKMLSPDILSVKLVKTNSETSYGFMEFQTRDLAVKNWEDLNKMGLTVALRYRNDPQKYENYSDANQRVETNEANQTAETDEVAQTSETNEAAQRAET